MKHCPEWSLKEWALAEGPAGNCRLVPGAWAVGFTLGLLFIKQVWD